MIVVDDVSFGWNIDSGYFGWQIGRWWRFWGSRLHKVGLCRDAYQVALER